LLVATCINVNGDTFEAGELLRGINEAGEALRVAPGSVGAESTLRLCLEVNINVGWL
jgi:hypothetical protein